MTKMIKDITLVIVGSVILAFSVSVFYIPFDILSGGVAGVAISLQYVLNIDPMMIINFLIVSLFLLGVVFLGKGFALKTVISSVVYPIALNIIDMFNIVVDIDPMLASVYGGIISGIGIGIVFRTGSSTGGMDIPPLILHKYTGIQVHTLVLIVDMITVILGMVTMGFEAVLIGFLSVYTCSFAINRVLVFGESAKSILIISDHLEEIKQMIHVDLDRGSTVLKGYGGYTNQDKDVLLIVIKVEQYPKLSILVNEIDPKAFIIVQDATQVRGEGFSLEHRV